MCEAVEKYAKEYAKEHAEEYAKEYAKQQAESVRLNALLDSIKKLMDNMKLGVEQAMNVLEISDSDREILMKEL